jgi:hypothetical protein
MSLLGRDIGEWVPAVENPERKARASVTSASSASVLPADVPPAVVGRSPEGHRQDRAGRARRRAVRDGDAARSGKTSLCETACLWALVYGHREFVALIGSDEEHAANMLDSIKVELEIERPAAGGLPRGGLPRCGRWRASTSAPAASSTGQADAHRLDGARDRAADHADWMAGHSLRRSGAIIRVAGITGRIRGMKHKRVDGTACGRRWC